MGGERWTIYVCEECGAHGTPRYRAAHPRPAPLCQGRQGCLHHPRQMTAVEVVPANQSPLGVDDRERLLEIAARLEATTFSAPVGSDAPKAPSEIDAGFLRDLVTQPLGEQLYTVAEIRERLMSNEAREIAAAVIPPGHVFPAPTTIEAHIAAAFPDNDEIGESDEA